MPGHKRDSHLCLRPLQITQRALRPFNVGGPEDNDTFFSAAAASEVSVFDINVSLSETLGDFGKHAGLTRGFDHKHFGLERQGAGFTQKHERPGWIAHHHAHHGMIDRVGCSKRVDINSGFCQRFTHARKCSGTICKKNRELGGGFDGELRRWVHAAFKVMPRMASDNSGKSRDLTPRSFETNKKSRDADKRFRTNPPTDAGLIMNLNATPKQFASPDNFGIVDSTMTAIAEHSSVKSPPPRRTVGFITASSIVIANIIGTGIFTSLGFQVADIQSGFALLMLWVVGGIAALCGALCYGELSAALPRSGGEYHFLSKIYHPALGFMAGFVSATVGFAAPVALAAMAFGKYFVGVFGVGSPVLLSFVVVWVVTAFHLGNLRVGSAFQNISTLVKLVLIGALIAAGLFVPLKQPINLLPAPGDTMSIFSGPFAIALVYVMYSYSGWNATAYITGEIKRPEKTVPRSLLVGTGLVIVIYVLLNAVFLATTPLGELKGQLEVALIASKHIFGSAGGRATGAVICFGLISSISSMTWIGPRVTMSMGEDHWLLRLLGRKNRHGIPTNAIVLQLLMVNLLLLTRSFEDVVRYTQFSLLVCSLLAVLGVIVLRFTHPKITRPYRVWLYPVPPAVFSVITIWMMFYLLRWHTAESLAGLGTALCGLLIYFGAGKRHSP